MKKMTFAFACASAVAAFAAAEDSAVISSINFDAYTAPFTGLSLAGDDGSKVAATASRWLYEGTAGATDASTVKAYDSANTGSPNYLELSTEGGTLWRSINTLTSSTKLGAAQAVPADTGLYIDTMVQFTPTEDGGEPEMTKDDNGNYIDKLAIWLRVTTDAEDATKSVTNLCVRGCAMTTEGTGRNETPVATPTTFVLTGAEVKAGTWHRLTVRAIGNIVNQGQVEGDFVSGFVVEIDRKTMRIANDGVSCDSKFTGYYESALVDGAAKLITDGQFIPSLMGYQNEDKSALQAVGFKGSGAIDSLQFTTEEPKTGQESEFNVDWGSEGVREVWGSTPPTATELAAIQKWASDNNLSADAVAGETGAAAYLLGLTAVPETVPELKITAITQTETGWTITIACKEQPDLSKINGSLVVKTAAELGGDWTSTVVTTPAATVTVTADGAKFMKAAIGKPVPPATE